MLMIVVIIKILMMKSMKKPILSAKYCSSIVLSACLTRHVQADNDNDDNDNDDYDDIDDCDDDGNDFDDDDDFDDDILRTFPQQRPCFCTKHN